MGFFSNITRLWLEKLKSVGFIYGLMRQSPEQLTFLAADMIAKHAEDDKWILLNYATGHAITGWALMEDRLILLASLLLRTTPEKTGLVFFSIINFQAWITIITELFELEDEFRPFQRRWNKLFERLRAEKDFRDRLAHHYIMSENVSDNPLGIPIKIASRIDMRIKSRKAAPMTANQVLDFRTRIDAISDDIQVLTDEMLKLMPSAAIASREKNGDQPT